MRTTDLQELLETVERVRRRLQPNLDPAFLNAVVHAEETCPEDDVAALNMIELALDQSLRQGDG
jgi:hypothetical protein